MGARVLYLHGITAIGGAERDLLTLLKAIDGEKWHPTVVCPSGPLQEQVEALPVFVHPLALPSWRKLSALLNRHGAVRRLRTFIENIQPDLVHVNDIWWVPHTVRALAGSASRRPPIIAHVRQEIERAKVRRYYLDQVDYVLAVSRQVQQSLELGGVRHELVKTVYSGLNIAAYQPGEGAEVVRTRFGIPVEAPLVGTVANLFHRKGYEVMFRALPVILAAVPDLHYIVVGTGEADYTERLRELSRELGIADRVHFTGFQDVVSPYLAAMDLYVHPALMEGFGIAVVEAMAMGKAVVATRAGGLPEVVTDQRSGLLVSPGDHKTLSAAVVSLLQDRATRDRMGACGRKRVQEQFSLDASVAQTEQVYSAVLASRKDR